MHNSHRLFIAAALTLAAFAGGAPAAKAQASFEPTPPYWGGLYMGVQGGWAWGKADVVEDPANPAPYNGAGNAWSYDPEGMIAGAHIGLDWESYALIMGLEVSAGMLSIEDEAADPASGGLDTVALGGSGYYADITGRIGFAPDRKLYYMKAGVAFADLGLEVNDSCSTAPCSANTIAAAGDGWRSGMVLGAGIGYALAQNLNLRLDYAWYDFGEIPVTGSSGGASYTWQHSVDFHAVTLGASFRF